MSEATTLTFADGVELVKNVLIPMRDGVRLAADLYVPGGRDGTDRWPVVMEYTPYRQDDVDWPWLATAWQRAGPLTWSTA